LNLSPKLLKENSGMNDEQRTRNIEIFFPLLLKGREHIIGSFAIPKVLNFQTVRGGSLPRNLPPVCSSGNLFLPCHNAEKYSGTNTP